MSTMNLPSFFQLCAVALVLIQVVTLCPYFDKLGQWWNDLVKTGAIVQSWKK
jgi:hypothetical protein